MALTDYEKAAVARGIQGWLAQAPPGTSAAYAAQWAEGHYSYFQGVGYNTYLQIATKVKAAQFAAQSLAVNAASPGLIKDLPVMPGDNLSGERFTYRVLIGTTNNTTGVLSTTVIDVTSSILLSAIDIQIDAETIARSLASSGESSGLQRNSFRGGGVSFVEIISASRAY